MAAEDGGWRAPARTWLPTAFGSSMLVLEIPVAAAAVARGAGGAAGLAAFGVSLAVLVVANSPALAITPLVVSDADHQPNRRTFGYALGVGVLTAVVLALLVTVPALFTLVRVATNLPDGIAAQVRTCLLALAPASVAVAVRRYFHGRLIAARRTAGISVATAGRLALSACAAWALVLVLPDAGAAVGGIALTAGAATEAAILGAAVARLRQPVTAPGAGLGALVRRHAALTSTRALNMAPQLITTMAVARSALAEPSLIVWPGLYGLLALFTGPTSDLESVVAGHLRHGGHPRDARRLTWGLALGFAALYAVVVLSPLGRGYLGGLLGTPPDATALGLRWAPLAIVVPALWVLRTGLRGFIIARGRAAGLLSGVAAHAVALTGVAAALTGGPLPGVANAGVALAAGLLAESAANAVVVRRAAAPRRMAGAAS
ncbi:MULTISPECIES: hypothetical protein [unclassified Amycolatopsis]|uniref:hypothetical protein n=1 Tax=unclassified Amycolatopsis TaxID=2618356 RepID=UPI0028748F8C|nr:MULTISPECIES: hypothetical protein [unclassified Amycolatopsis]MDS0139962.1 hypothetical protein [Amycolatopsis sp. 505]MDS0148126.1 hypothetical protein [Amycolatopsis sp. CM201R]